jgi:glycosyltransferase involved in cell wall biosynthesis
MANSNDWWPDMKIQLSIIVPVYNVEDYIRDCLQSVFKQIPEAVEIIVVDDGSPDRSMEIVRREFHHWIENGYLVLLEQENKGPGAARNAGLACATGRYIGFLDSDDVLLDGFFDELMDRIQLGVADVFEYGFKRFKTTDTLESQPYRRLYPFTGLKTIASVRNTVFCKTRWYPSLRVYRRSVLAGFRFPEAVHYEDTMSIPSIFLKNFFIHYTDKPLLGYRDRPGSITSRHTHADMQSLHAYYLTVPADGIQAQRLMKIGLARTLAYFYSEMGATDFPMQSIINDMSVISIDGRSRKALDWSDWLFFKVPRLYMLINSLRVKPYNRRNDS